MSFGVWVFVQSSPKDPINISSSSWGTTPQLHSQPAPLARLTLTCLGLAQAAQEFCFLPAEELSSACAKVLWALAMLLPCSRCLPRSTGSFGLSR